ncbi:DUF2333 family protein [Amphritea balenae]|uniref:DUF2333 family protein n=1 Tax=Amphritea balenae TaxID=452629 RepID=A0A3P1SM71_9GAMM|nr:DUF2333 family protein [Amphritea balenae]RRC98351.1 DUF2333 family protein [Amphritea balenae]GGK81204.1 hypothetical protein GCM10007941_34520 [Amphritea balenae]
MDMLQRWWFMFWDKLVAMTGSVRGLGTVGVALGLYLLISVVVGIWWSFEPDSFEVEPVMVQTAEGAEKPVIGSATVSSLITITETLLDKPGGYLSNDRLPPGLWLDNVPNWEFGVLVQARDMSRAMRKDFSRSQSQSTEDVDLKEAEPLLHFDNDSWILPSSEGEYKKSLKYLRAYEARLIDPQQQNAQFYARADNLRGWLADVSTRLGSLSQRLSASVGQKRVNTDLAGEAGARQSTDNAAELEVKTGWMEIDDVFYEARGTAWALAHLLKAVEVDFATSLEKKNALISLRQIIRELEATQSTIWSPLILNGTEFGLLANHSLVMASYISRANAAIIDLRALLEQG